MDPPAAEQQAEDTKSSVAAEDESVQDEGYCTKLDIDASAADNSGGVAATTNRTGTNRTNCTEDVVVRSDDDEVRTYVEQALKALNQANEPASLSQYEKLQQDELHDKIDLFSHNTMALLSWIEEYIDIQDNKFSAESSPSEMQDRSNRVASHAERLYNDIKKDGPLLLANLKHPEGETIKTVIDKVESKYRKMQSGYYDKVDLPQPDPPITPPPSPIKPTSSPSSIKASRYKASQELDRFDAWEEFMEEYYKMIEWTEVIKRRIEAAVTVVTGSRFVLQDIEEELSEYSGKRTRFRTLANCVAEFYPSLTVETRDLQREIDTTCDRLITEVRVELNSLRAYIKTPPLMPYAARLAEYEDACDVIARRYEYLPPRPLPDVPPTALVPYYYDPLHLPRPVPYYDPLKEYSYQRLNALEREAIRRDLLMLYDVKQRACGGDMSDFSFHQIRDKLGFKDLRPKPLTSTPKKSEQKSTPPPSEKSSVKEEPAESDKAASDKDAASTAPASEAPASEAPAAEEPAAEEPAAGEPASVDDTLDAVEEEVKPEESAAEEEAPSSVDGTAAPASEPAPAASEVKEEEKVVPPLDTKSSSSSVDPLPSPRSKPYSFLNLDAADAPNVSELPSIIIEFHKMLKHCEDQCYKKMSETPMGWDPTHLRRLLAMNDDCQRTLSGKKYDLSVINAAAKKKYRYRMNEEKDCSLKWCVTMLDQRYNNLVLHCIDTQLILERRMDAIMKRGGASGRLVHPSAGLWTERGEDMRSVPTGYDTDYILPTTYY